LLGTRAKNVCCQDVALRGFIDRFNRVLLEQIVTPGNQVIQIFHDHVVLISQVARSRDCVRLERFVQNGLISVKNVLPGLLIVG
jgi:hypothetical protein